MNIAIIPASSGSKCITRNNVKEFCSKPMIAYAIAAAKESGLFENVLVSADDHMKKMLIYSKKYILSSEYSNRTPISVEYQGEKEKLFKRDFGKLLLEIFEIKLIDYGFIWGHIYDTASFDDITWW